MRHLVRFVVTSFAGWFGFVLYCLVVFTVTALAIGIVHDLI